MGIILDKLQSPDIGTLQKNITLGQIIAEAPKINHPRILHEGPPLGRLGQLDNQHHNNGLTRLTNVAKYVSKAIFGGFNFLYMKLKKERNEITRKFI